MSTARQRLRPRPHAWTGSSPLTPLHLQTQAAAPAALAMLALLPCHRAVAGTGVCQPLVPLRTWLELASCDMRCLVVELWPMASTQGAGIPRRRQPLPREAPPCRARTTLGGVRARRRCMCHHRVCTQRQRSLSPTPGAKLRQKAGRCKDLPLSLPGRMGSRGAQLLLRPKGPWSPGGQDLCRPRRGSRGLAGMRKAMLWQVQRLGCRLQRRFGVQRTLGRTRMRTPTQSPGASRRRWPPGAPAATAGLRSCGARMLPMLTSAKCKLHSSSAVICCI